MADENRPHIARDPELERARVWWKEHGRAIVAGVAIGLSAVVGFNYWQHYRETRAETASDLFERMRGELAAYQAASDASEAPEASETSEAPDASDASETETEPDAAQTSDADADAAPGAPDPNSPAVSTDAIDAIANQLMSDYAATPYAAHAAFALAKLAVEDGDLDKAAQTLEWALANADDDGLLHIARLRLASVLLAQDEADAAVAVLTVEDTAGFAARYHELLGDARLQQGNTADARDAYRSAIDALPPDSQQRALLQLKLDDLGQ